MSGPKVPFDNGDGMAPPTVTGEYLVSGCDPELNGMPTSHVSGVPSAESMSAALRRAEQERDIAKRRAIIVNAELASAREELDAVRTARDNLDRRLALAHREVLELDAQIKLCPRCGVEVDAEINGTEPPEGDDHAEL